MIFSNLYINERFVRSLHVYSVSCFIKGVFLLKTFVAYQKVGSSDPRLASQGGHWKSYTREEK